MDIIRLTIIPAVHGRPAYFEGEAITGLSGITWVERFNEAGEFKLTAPFFKGNAAEKLPLGSLLTHVNTAEVMVVENRELEQSRDKDPELTISGRSLEVILDTRVVGSNRKFPYATTPLADFTLPANKISSQIVSLIQQHIGGGAYTIVDPADKIPYLFAQNVSTSPRRGASRIVKRGSLYEAVQELLKLGTLGIRIVRPGFGSPYSDRIILQVHAGADRRRDVAFTNVAGDIQQANYLWSTKTLKNSALVTGRWLETMVKGPQTGSDRRVMFVDGSDIDRSQETAPTGATRVALLNKMVTRGRQVLASQTSVGLTNAELSPTVSHVYRREYSTGDLVTIRGDFDAATVRRVIEYTETEDETSTSSYPTFGDV